MLRADARENRDRLLKVAAVAFGRDGAETSLKAIAAEAGVGIGTLYRQFPTRDALYIAVHRAEIAALAARADDLLAAEPPMRALSLWLDEFVEFLHAKHGMAQMFRSVMADGANLFLDLRDDTNAAALRLLTAAADAGQIRSGADPADVLAALHGLTLATSDPDQLRRLVKLVVDGLRVDAAT